MSSQPRHDLIAAISILAMFVGAFLLPITWLGLALVSAGAAAILFLMARAVRARP